MREREAEERGGVHRRHGEEEQLSQITERSRRFPGAKGVRSTWKRTLGVARLD